MRFESLAYGAGPWLRIGMPSMTREHTSGNKYDASQGCCPFAGDGEMVASGDTTLPPVLRKFFNLKNISPDLHCAESMSAGWFQLLKNDSPAGLGPLTSGHLGEV